jgi:L-rhamnose mutarotase
MNTTASPESGYPVRQFGKKTKRYVQLLTLEDNPELIRQYRLLHSPEQHWVEIREGIRAVGILEMEIYIHGHTIVMIVETPEDFDWTPAMQRLATLPRQAEWEAVVGEFQRCSAEATSDEKWQLMDRMFYLYS